MFVYGLLVKLQATVAGEKDKNAIDDRSPDTFHILSRAAAVDSIVVWQANTLASERLSSFNAACSGGFFLVILMSF